MQLPNSIRHSFRPYFSLPSGRGRAERYTSWSKYFYRFLSIFFLLLTLIVLFIELGYAAENVSALKNQAKKYYWGQGVEQNYSKALELYLKAARRGDGEAQFISGGMFFRGMGVEKNFPQAFKLLQQAAINGKSSPESERIIAQAYLQGIGTYKNYEKGVQWYKKAAEKGDGEAQNTLGYIYFVGGNGVEQDVTKGGAYFLQAAYNNSAIAQYNVGIMYLTGQGVDGIDLIKAYGWMNIAATNGHGPAIGARNYIETLLSPEEITDAQEYTDKMSESGLIRP